MHPFPISKKRLFIPISISLIICLLFVPSANASDLKILTNQLGYEKNGPKHAVILANPDDQISSCSLKSKESGQQVVALTVHNAGPVKKWRDWHFWTLDFDSFRAEGEYFIECASSGGSVRSLPFRIQQLLLERNTLSDVIYFFKEERSSGRFDQADRHLPFDGQKKGTLDAHGGWYDATGDYGKHLSHLSFSTYFNPQQIPFVIYSLLKSDELLRRRALQGLTQYERRLLDEAMFGADYLVRVKDPSGSFYRSVSAPGVKQLAQDRKVA